MPDIDIDHLSDRDLLVLTVTGVNEVKVTLCSQDKRLRALEDWRWAITGGLSMLVFLIIVFGVYALTHWK